MSINRVVLTGNLTRDSRLRQLPSGTSVLEFGIAVNERRKNRETGEWEDRPNYVDCNLFGRRAEALSRYLTKGTKVAVEGKLRWSSWEDRESGSRRSRLDVTVDELEFVGRGGGQRGQEEQKDERGQAYADCDLPF